MIRWIVLIAGIVGAAGVGLGAFAAHGLEAKLIKDGYSEEAVAKKLQTCDVAVRYHLVHAVALLGLSAASPAWARRRRSLAALCFVLGLGLFCGVLYSQAIAGLVGMNWIVPLGGLCFILGWLCIALAAFTTNRHAADDSALIT